MIITGPSIGYVHKGEPGGYTKAGLLDTRDMLNKDIPEATKMDAVLGRIIDAEPGIGIIQELREEGLTLMGAQKDFKQAAPEALMFAKGSPKDGLSFSVVRMGIWITAAGEYKPASNEKMLSGQRDTIRNMFLNAGLNELSESEDDGLGPWGVVVNRMTTIIPVQPQEGDIQEEFIYGHRKDLLAIAGLEVPQALRNEITKTVQEYHTRENDQATQA